MQYFLETGEMKTVTIIPLSKRENNAVRRLGPDNWVVLEESNPFCFQSRTALMVEKNGHIRWMLKEQTTNEKEV
jgi:hypothetical protein